MTYPLVSKAFIFSNLYYSIKVPKSILDHEIGHHLGSYFGKSELGLYNELGNEDRKYQTGIQYRENELDPDNAYSLQYWLEGQVFSK